MSNIGLRYQKVDKNDPQVTVSFRLPSSLYYKSKALARMTKKSVTSMIISGLVLQTEPAFDLLLSQQEEREKMEKEKIVGAELSK